jgi:pimeloyl-ACP methyl ester carboxylesterase
MLTLSRLIVAEPCHAADHELTERPDAAGRRHSACAELGDGPTSVVAVHGITASAMTWPAVARHLSSEWTLVAADLRGRGAAAELPGPYGPRRHVEDVCALARSRRAQSGAVLVGHSMGAFIALLAAAAEPGLFRYGSPSTTTSPHHAA